MRFLDSNIWLYALWSFADPRHATAVLCTSAPNVAVSTQVINEVCSNLMRKAGFTHDQIERLVRYFYTAIQVIPVTRESMLKACDLRRRYSFSCWDSQMVACALLGGCADFDSEDLQDGLLVEGALTIHNPFKVPVP